MRILNSTTTRNTTDKLYNPINKMRKLYMPLNKWIRKRKRMQDLEEQRKNKQTRFISGLYLYQARHFDFKLHYKPTTTGKSVVHHLEGSNKTYKMTQKFIQSAQKTTKKLPYFQEERPRKFTRKRSERDHSYDSKKSREDSTFSQYIRRPNPPSNIKISLVNDDFFQLMDEANNSSLQSQGTERIQQKAMILRTNNNRQPLRQQCTLNLRIKILETQLKVKEGECQRYKLQLDEEKARRRGAQSQRKAFLKESVAFERQKEQLLMQIKKLNKQKQILNKQIQFLQKINYDQKTRSVLSYREQHMQEQILKLRELLEKKRTARDVDLQDELKQMRCLKQIAEQKFRSMQSLVEVQKRSIKKLKDVVHEQRVLTSQKIINSEQYCELRDRFKKFIEQYKEVRMQNTTLKSMLQQQQNELVLSDSQVE